MGAGVKSKYTQLTKGGASVISTPLDGQVMVDGSEVKTKSVYRSRERHTAKHTPPLEHICFSGQGHKTRGHSAGTQYHTTTTLEVE